MIGDIIIMLIAGTICYGAYRVWKNDRERKRVRDNHKVIEEIRKNHNGK